jgi:hypothetical protein
VAFERLSLWEYFQSSLVGIILPCGKLYLQSADLFSVFTRISIAHHSSLIIFGHQCSSVAMPSSGRFLMIDSFKDVMDGCRSSFLLSLPVITDEESTSFLFECLEIPSCLPRE